MSACNCCTEPPRPAPELVCESRSASKTKEQCGFEHEGQLYKTATVTSRCERDETTVGEPGFAGNYNVIRESGSIEIIETATFSTDFPPCVSTGTRSGTSSYSIETKIYNSEDVLLSESADVCSTTMDNDGFWSGTRVVTVDGESETYPISDRCAVCSPVSETEYSNPVTPETDAELIQRTIASLPETPNGTACAAFADRAPFGDEDVYTYTLRRVRWKLRHAPTPTCYLKVWLRTKFEPEGGGSPTFEDLDPYVWEGTGNPCLPDPEKSVAHEDNLIEGEFADLLEPDSDGTKTVEIVKWSYLPDYTPGEGEPNGFPDPE